MAHIMLLFTLYHLGKLELTRLMKLWQETGDLSAEEAASLRNQLSLLALECGQAIELVEVTPPREIRETRRRGQRGLGSRNLQA
jgi:hypothetical protein